MRHGTAARTGRRPFDRRHARATSADRGEDSGLRAVARFRTVAAAAQRGGGRGRPGTADRPVDRIDHPMPADPVHPGRVPRVDDLRELAEPLLSRSAAVSCRHDGAAQRGVMVLGLRRTRLSAGRRLHRGAGGAVSDPLRLRRRRPAGAARPAHRPLSLLLRRGHRRPADLPGGRDAPAPPADRWPSWPPRA